MWGWGVVRITTNMWGVENIIRARTLSHTMSISSELIAYCKHVDNSIIGCWEPPPPGYELEVNETDDGDWTEAITVRLRQMRLEEVVAEVGRRVQDEGLREALVGEIERVVKE